MAKITLRNYEQLVTYTAQVVEGGLEKNTRPAMREALEELSDLYAEETELIFNDDGTVEIASDEEADGDGEGDEENEDDE